MAPITTPIALFVIPPFPIKALPIRREAKAIVTIPDPMVTFTDFWLWANKHPERAVKDEEIHSPIIVVKAGFIDEDFTMSGLSPVALKDRPNLVFKKNERKRTTKATKIKAVTSL